ncbi:MAG: hypothetical protein DI631_11215 [Acinetobacter johnsonii]|jgi:hypothetical protein|nr:MAG: hypothetical protein DI631_11215 [Acinetobacter johnsonii]
MILSGPSKDFFKRRFFQNHKVLKVMLYIFFMAIFPILLSVMGFFISTNIGTIFSFGVVEHFFLSVPLTLGFFIFGLCFFLWLTKD